jgi:hypothetical protein
MSIGEKLSWQAPEFRTYEKNSGWYVTLISVAILIIGFFVIQKDLFAAITTAILAVLVVIFSKQKPEIVSIEMDHKAVKIGNIEVPYKQIKHFWVVHKEHHKTLNMETTTLINNMIILELGSQDPENVRMFLSQHLPEHKQTEPTPIQRLTHWLKF